MHSPRLKSACEQRPRAPRWLLCALLLGACSDQRTVEADGPHEPRPASPEVDAAAPAGAALEAGAGAAPGEPSAARVQPGALSTPIVIQVVDGARDTPIAGATAVVLDRGSYDLTAYFTARRAGRPEAELRREFGQTAVTDERGELAIDWSGKTTRVWVETNDGRVAHGNVGDSVEGRLVLRLPEDAGIVVLVHDGSDTPVAGVPIVATDSRGRSLAGLAPIAHTNEAGLARLDPAPLLLGTTDAGAEPVFIGLGVVAAEPIGARVALTQPSQTPIELVLPPFGAVNVRVARRDGTPEEGEQPTLHMRALAGGETVDPATAWLDDRLVVAAALTDGEFRFPHVLLGQRVFVQTELLRGDIELPPLIDAHGPARAGETVELSLELAPMRTFVGRLATGSDGPLETRGWTAQITAGDRTAPCDVDVAADGNFEFEVDTRHLARGLTEATFERREHTTSDIVTDHTLPVTLPPAAADADTTELGTVHVERPPIVVAGRVVNERSAPVAGATIQVQQRYICSERSTEGGSVDGAGWKHVGTTRSGADGAFEIRGATSGLEVRDTETPTEELVLTVSAPRRATRKYDATLARSDVVVTLVQAGSIRARLEHGTARFPVRVGIGLEDEDGAVVRAREDMSRRVDLDALEPGRYVLKVYGPADGEPCLVLADLVVESGAECADPRLDPLDLTETLAIGQLEVVNEAGTELEDISIWIMRRGEGAHEPSALEPFRQAESDWIVFRRVDPPIVEVSAPHHAASEQLAREGLNRHVLVRMR